jgi:hypothetical protein
VSGNVVSAMNRFRHRRLAAGLLGGIAVAAGIRPGVWSASESSEIPLPASGYQAYLVGETHGLERNEPFQLQYLERLRRTSGLRDVAIEEDSVYEAEAQAFIRGEGEALPPELCLRAGVLNGLRRINQRLRAEEQIRVHLIDIDSPASAIASHLRAVQRNLNANNVKVPEASNIGRDGLAAIAKFRQQPRSESIRSELRTIALSIVAYREGLEVGLGEPKGSPYLESREEAVAANLIDLIQTGRAPSILVLYGADHVSRTLRKDGGPERNQPFQPMALRLRNAGIRAFSAVTLPLAGELRWRGRHMELPWTAADGRLSSGETFQQLLAAYPKAEYFYIDASRERSSLPSQDISRMDVDAFVLFRSSPAMTDRCAPGRGKR